MNKQQIAHLNRILEKSRELITEKYTKGAAEHKSLLSEDYTKREVIVMSIEEAVDQLTYLLTLLEMEDDERS
jgi:hypothetical protein